ncbi:MAG TPA: DUF5652 family protein [Patescibacteria group bacterium]|nr:DUF5652 family protein [Patescibacteria group bacterium]
MPWYLGNNVSVHNMWWGGGWLWSIPGVFIFLAAWSVVWTGLALWHAGRRCEKWWFIFFLLVHTAGIAEILYLVFVAKIFSSGAKPITKGRKKSR